MQHRARVRLQDRDDVPDGREVGGARRLLAEVDTIFNSAAVAAGSYSLEVTGQSGAEMMSVSVGLDVTSSAPGVPAIQ